MRTSVTLALLIAMPFLAPLARAADPCSLAGEWTLGSFKIDSPKPESAQAQERPDWVPESFVISCPKLWGAPALDYTDGKGERVSVPLAGREPLKFQLTSKKTRLPQVTVTAYTMRLGPDGALALAAIRTSRLPGQDLRPWEGHSLYSLSVTAVYGRKK